MGSRAGVMRTAAKRLGLTLSEYEQRIAGGEKWCTTCKAWRQRADFVRDASRSDGLKAACRRHRGRRQLTLGLRVRPDRLVDPRDGDRRQARRRVNHLVDRGRLPAANDVPCADCGHVWSPGERRHEYDHHRGYAPEHHEDVEPVCTTCHHRRENERRG